MQRITLRIPRLRCYRAGDRYRVCWNGGHGEIDGAERPLLGDAPFWPGSRAHDGHLHEPHLCGGHVDQAVQDGHLVGRHLEHGHLQPAAVLRFVSQPLLLGHFRIAVRTMDAGGNALATAPEAAAYTINASPRPASDLTVTGYDDGDDQVTFGFRPSPDCSGL